MGAEHPDWNRIGLNYLLYMNVAWTLVNLLPIMPLDGGQMLSYALGPRWQRVTYAIGLVVAAPIAIYALYRHQWYLGALFAFLAFVNFKRDTTSLPTGVR